VPQIARSDYESRVQGWINRQRTARGLRSLRLEACTDRAAERWAKHLAETSAFYHQSMRKVLRTCGASYAGETLAKGSIGPRRVVRLWMQSPGHRRILLSKSPRRIGVGAFPDAKGAWVVVADFTRFS
jgi:uncharacterized protein YkwD